MYNPYLVIPFLVWVITQFLKFILSAAGGKIDFRYLYASGGMPSVHSAVVTSLATTAFLVDGPSSSIFGVTAILAAIVMYDSFGVRRSSGEQAAAINLILDSLQEDQIKLSHPQQRLRELLGHKPLEVTIGALIGFVLACLFNIDKLSGLIAYLTTPVAKPTIYALAAVSLLLVVGAVISRWFYIKKYRKLDKVVTVIKRATWLGVTLGAIGLFVAFLAYEKVPVATWFVWPVLFVAVVLGSFGWLYNRNRKEIPQFIADNAAQIDKSRWFEGPNKKRRAAKARKKRR